KKQKLCIAHLSVSCLRLWAAKYACACTSPSRMPAHAQSVAVVHRGGLVAGDLCGCLAGSTRAIHIPHYCPPGIMKELPRQSGFLSCRPPGPVAMLNPLSLPVKDVRA